MEQGEGPEKMKALMKKNGWSYKDQLGSGYFFVKEGVETIIGSEMWTRKYMLFQIKEEILHQ